MHYKATKTDADTMDDLLFGNIEDHPPNQNQSEVPRRRIYYGIQIAQALPFSQQFLDDAYAIRETLQRSSDIQVRAEGKTQSIWRQKKQVADLYEALVHIGDMYSLRGGTGSADGQDVEERKIKEWLKFLQYKFIQEVTSGVQD